ncbi:glycosyltransferase family 2 protein [Pontibacter arcticus]|uniref:Glycoside hydrolase family 2 n=1 Tax=Pontibacter arcticus TaxID=2080288 RepID=A0A364RDN0_9BACT|nr:glycosyltransferase [Pontibacter arcticus]RAU82367.1 glycoside hydrolase family 2 [Pontibacter arcticus]
MATAVLDLELENLPPNVSVSGHYTKAFVLLRYKGRPEGKIILDVRNGIVEITENLSKILNTVSHTLWQSQVHAYLNWDEKAVAGYTLPGATIAVCTRDRPDDLERCLEALMRLPDLGQEFLIIDNCPSTDATQKLVAAYPRVRYVREDRPGLNVARNRAMREASNEIVAFTDDDATPDAGWLKAILLNFSYPLVQCVTGLTMPLELETEAQETFEKFTPFGRGFRRILHSENTLNPLATGRIGAGANMALRKSICHEVGFFDEALDAGTPTHSGGDHEIFTRILVAGYTIIYEPAALSWHRHRRSMQELESTLYGYGVGVYALLTRHLLINKEWGVFKIAFNWFWYSQLKSLVKALLKRPGAIPAPLILAELKGCLAGPGLYFKSRKKLKARAAHV